MFEMFTRIKMPKAVFEKAVPRHVGYWHFSKE